MSLSSCGKSSSSKTPGLAFCDIHSRNKNIATNVRTIRDAMICPANISADIAFQNGRDVVLSHMVMLARDGYVPLPSVMLWI